MSFFGFIADIFGKKNTDFEKKQENFENVGVGDEEDCDDMQEELNLVRVGNIDVHKDLKGLIWFADGLALNYLPENDVEMIGCLLYDLSEPSAIYTKLKIVEPQNYESVDVPDYFPKYKTLSPEQRCLYLEFLKNPYNTDFDVGYAFVLFYGLERHLLLGKYKRAREIVRKMREKIDNHSFLIYSTMSLLASSFVHKDFEYMKDFMNTFDDNCIDKMNKDFFFAMCFYCGMPLSAKWIMQMCNFWGFTNKLYVKNIRIYLKIN